MDTITLDASKQIGVMVSDGRMKGARLKWTAPGLQIYLLGTVTPQNRDTLNNIAVNECQARHIPAIALKKVFNCGERKRPPELKDAFLKDLFSELIESGYNDYRFDCAMCGKPCMSVDDNGHCATCRQVWNS